MGKRSDFPRRERDFYPTPPSAIVPLLPFLGDYQYYVEPMSGDGALVDYLNDTHLECILSSDIEPQAKGIEAGKPNPALNVPELMLSYKSLLAQ